MSYAEELGLNWAPQVIGVVVGLAWLLLGVLSGRRLVWSKPITLYVIWALWSGLGILVTISAPYFFQCWQTLMKVALITWVLSQCVRTRADLLLCFVAIGFMCLLIYHQGVDSIMSAASFGGSQDIKGARAEETLLVNSNALGLFGIIVLLGIVACLLASHSLVVKAISLIPAPFTFYIIAASGSRKAMICVVLAAVAIFYYHFRKTRTSNVAKKLVFFFFGVSIVGGSVYAVSKLPFFFRLTQTFTDVGTMQDQPRYRYFITGMKATAENPFFGLGLGGFTAAGLSGIGTMHYSHSTVTETLSCTGVPGFLLYFGGQLALFNLLRKLRKKDLPKHDAAMVNVSMVIFWVILFFSVLAVMTASRFIWPLFGAICGYLAHLKSQYPDRPVRAAVHAPNPRLGRRFKA